MGYQYLKIDIDMSKDISILRTLRDIHKRLWIKIIHKFYNPYYHPAEFDDCGYNVSPSFKGIYFTDGKDACYRFHIYNKYRAIQMGQDTSTPFIKLDVSYRVNEYADDIKPPLWWLNKYSLFENSGEDYCDYCIPFTIKEHPKPLISYDIVKRRLRGNILPQTEIDHLIKFISYNYKELLRVWYMDPYRLGRWEDLYDPNNLKPLGKND